MEYEMVTLPDGEQYEICARDWLYRHLIKQEADFWYNHQDSYNKEDYDFIVDRRGFNKEELENLNTLLLKLNLEKLWN